MAKSYHDEGNTAMKIFGPISDPVTPVTEMSEEREKYTKAITKDSESIKTGYGRITEKANEIRQSISQAVMTSSSGSGKIVFEHYDILVSLWRGSESTRSLPFDVDGDTFNDTENDAYVRDDLLQSDADEENNDEIETGEKAECVTSSGKRKSESQIPRLIDDKRNHMQKTLSAVQRDQILLNEAKEDTNLR